MHGVSLTNNKAQCSVSDNNISTINTAVSWYNILLLLALYPGSQSACRNKKDSFPPLSATSVSCKAVKFQAHASTQQQLATINTWYYSVYIRVHTMLYFFTEVFLPLLQSVLLEPVPATTDCIVLCWWVTSNVMWEQPTNTASRGQIHWRKNDRRILIIVPVQVTFVAYQYFRQNLSTSDTPPVWPIVFSTKTWLATL